MRVLVLLAFSLLCVSFPEHSQIALAQAVIEAPSSTGLTIVPSTDPDFPVLIDRYYPGLRTKPSFEAAAPYIVLLKNTTSVPIRAFSVRFDCIARKGLPAEPEYVKFLFDPVSEFPKSDRNGHVFAPNEVRLIAPGYLMDSPKAYVEFSSRFTWSLPRMVAYSLDKEQGEASPYARVSVDAVVYSNHHMRGQNSSKLFQKYAAIRDARRDERTAAETLLQDNGKVKAVTAQLKQHAAKGLAVRQDPTTDLKIYYSQQYELARSLEASRLRRFVEKNGVPRTRRHVETLLREPTEEDIID